MLRGMQGDLYEQSTAFYFKFNVKPWMSFKEGVNMI